MSREDNYVDLSVISGEKVDLEWHNSDREAIMNLKYLNQKSICLDKIWEPTDQLVMVRGVAGIGKSTMIKRYILKWAKEEILTDANDNEKIDFLFFLECRELNTKPKISSLEELLKEKYPHIFHYLNLSDLQKIADRVMIVVDGLDELQGVYEENEKMYPTTELIKTLIDTKSGLLKGHKTIACGRPKACEFIKSKIHSQKTKLIEVCGFDEKRTIEYIDHFFGGDSKRAEKVKEIIKRPNLRVMSSVPVLLWVLCLLYSEDFDEKINSSTELYSYAFITFLRNHLRGNKNYQDQNLGSLVRTPEFGRIVYSLSKLSVKTYMEHEMIFTDDDIKGIHCPIHLEMSGLIVKHSTGNIGSEAYQFRHLTFQEYLCALFLCLAKGVSQFSTNRELSSCTPTILGIHSLISEGTSKLFVPFYQNLEMIHNSSRSILNLIKVPYHRFCYIRFIHKHLNTTKMIEQHIIKNEDGRSTFDCDTTDFKFVELMKNIREKGEIVDEDISQKISKCYIEVNIHERYSVEILKFLKSLNVKSIDYLFLHHRPYYWQSALDLIEMTEKNLTLKITLTNNALGFFYSSSHNGTLLLIPINDLSTILKDETFLFTEIIKFHNSFVVSKDHKNGISVNINEFEEVNRLIFNLIDGVLGSNGRKCLSIEQILIEEQHLSLIREIMMWMSDDQCEHREHFDKIDFRKGVIRIDTF